MLRFVRNCKNCCPKQLNYFAFSETINDSSSYSESWPEINILSFLDFSHSNWDVVVSHFCFNLHFQMTNYVEHVFMYSFTICISFLESCLFRSFLNYVVSFLIVRFKCSLYILHLSTLSDMWFAIISSSLWLAFSFFHRAGIFNFNKVQLIKFFLSCIMLFVLNIKNYDQIQGCIDFSPKNHIVLHFTLRSLIHFK